MSLSPSRLEIKTGKFRSPTVSDGDMEGEPSGRGRPLAAMQRESSREQVQGHPGPGANGQRADDSPFETEQHDRCGNAYGQRRQIQ